MTESLSVGRLHRTLVATLHRNAPRELLTWQLGLKGVLVREVIRRIEYRRRGHRMLQSVHLRRSRRNLVRCILGIEYQFVDVAMVLLVRIMPILLALVRAEYSLRLNTAELTLTVVLVAMNHRLYFSKLVSDPGFPLSRHLHPHVHKYHIVL